MAGPRRIFSECRGNIYNELITLSAREHEQRTDAVVRAAGDADDGVEFPLRLAVHWHSLVGPRDAGSGPHGLP